MADRVSKQELVDDAESLGIDTDGKTKPQLEEAIEARNPEELGPVIPEGLVPEITPSGSPTVGVQPQTERDIPEAGR